MSGGGREQIYAIAYTDKDPERAKKVVEELLNLFVETVLGESRFDTTSTQQFLNDQIKVYEAKLESAETALKDFKRKNVGLMPEAGQSYFSQLSMATDQLSVARLELDEAINRRNELKQQIANIKVPSDLPVGNTVNPAYVRLNELLRVYTENHPEVIAVQRIIDEQQRQAEKEPIGGDDTGEQAPSLALHQSLAYQELKAALGETEAEVAALRVRSKQYQSKMDHLQKMIDTIPQVEADLIKLNRDYGIIKGNYEGLVERRESALITFEVEKSTDDVQFKIIDPPIVPVIPTGPKRLLFLTGALAAGIGAGAGLVFGLILLRPTIDTLQDLRETTELPVFGSVSMVDAVDQRTKIIFKAISFWSLLTGFLLVFVTLAGMLYLRIDLKDIIEMIKGVNLL
ncbi:MAG: hypothetical protein GY807_11335 [Gammaproteobacteria bacterium]|nr:hypothetical protein [Gammaproteobacteria bacterium]